MRNIIAMVIGALLVTPSLSAAAGGDKLALKGEWVLKVDDGKEVTTGKLVVAEHKDGKVKGALEFGKYKGEFTGTEADAVLKFTTDDGKRFSIFLADWKPSKMGFGTFVGAGKKVAVQIARSVELTERPVPDPDVLKIIKGGKLELAEKDKTLTFVPTKVEDSGEIEATYGEEKVKAALIGNVLTFTYEAGDRRAMIIYAKDGKTWGVRTSIVNLRKD